MFQASRQLFHRSSTSVTGDSSAAAGTGSKGKGRAEAAKSDRHPAMRGLDVSPVHGHHCICQRCDQHRNAA